MRDEDDETPLFFCENVPTAKLLLEYGADATLKNKDGLSSAENAAVNEWTDVATFLWDATGTAPVPRHELLERIGDDEELPVQHGIAEQEEHGPVGNEEVDARMEDMLSRVEEIMLEAERTGEDPTEKLTEAIGHTLAQQVVEGYRMAN